MPGHLTFLLGLAGSGKTWLVTHVLHYDKAFEESFAENEEKHGELVGLLQAGKRCILSEARYLSGIHRDAFLNRLRRRSDTTKS